MLACLYNKDRNRLLHYKCGRGQIWNINFITTNIKDEQCYLTGRAEIQTNTGFIKYHRWNSPRTIIKELRMCATTTPRSKTSSPWHLTPAPASCPIHRLSAPRRDPANRVNRFLHFEWKEVLIIRVQYSMQVLNKTSWAIRSSHWIILSRLGLSICKKTQRRLSPQAS